MARTESWADRLGGARKRFLDVGDAKLRDREHAAEDRDGDSLLALDDVKPDGIETVVELVRHVELAESAREKNLNGRGTAVASVAALIVSISGALAKSVFDEPNWDSTLQKVTLCFFLFALAAVSAAMVMALLVLRPARGPKTRAFIGETISELWIQGYALRLVKADKERIQLLYLDRALRTLPVWHFRNRRKARWLRRSYVILGSGIVLIGFAGLLAISHTAGVHLYASLPIVALGVSLVWLAIKRDWVRAKEVPDSALGDADEARKEVERIGALLEKPSPRRGPFLVVRYAQAYADALGLRGAERDEVAEKEIASRILAGRAPDEAALARRAMRMITDADLRAQSLSQDEIDEVRRYYLRPDHGDA